MKRGSFVGFVNAEFGMSATEYVNFPNLFEIFHYICDYFIIYTQKCSM